MNLASASRSRTNLYLATTGRSRYSRHMRNSEPAISPDELRRRLAPFCEKHRIRRLDLFGSAAVATAPRAAWFELDSAYQGQEGFELVKRAAAEGPPMAPVERRPLRRIGNFLDRPEP